MNTYEKKYNYVLKRAKALKECSLSPRIKDWVDSVFPELKESENEKIRKDIKRAISVALDYSYFDKKTANNCLAWLEKQGQTFTPKDVDDAYLKGVSDTKHKLEKQGEEKPIFNVVDWQPSKVDGKIHNIYNSGVEPKFSEKKELKKIENSPILSNSAKTGKNWSEEDEKCIDNCCLLIGAADNCYEKTFKDDCIHYLQNLKKRMCV